jgi:hypothetical protein
MISGPSYDLRDHHFGAAEERHREAHVGDARKAHPFIRLVSRTKPTRPPLAGKPIKCPESMTSSPVPAHWSPSA